MPLPDYMSAMADIEWPDGVLDSMTSGYDDEVAANAAILAERDADISRLTLELATTAAVVESLQATNLALITSIGVNPTTNNDNDNNDNDNDGDGDNGEDTPTSLDDMYEED